MEDRDEILLNELRSGDISAYERLFTLYYKPLVAKALYMLNDQMEAEDVVQIMFIEFWSKKHYASINYSLRVYLNRAVKNRCLNILEARAVQKKRMDSLALIFNEAYEEDKPESEQAANYLESGLASLSAQQLNAFTLIHAEDRKYKEAAIEMGISINSLKTHLKLAIRSLREHLKKSR